MQLSTVIAYGALITINLVIFLTYLSEGMDSKGSLWVMITSTGTSLWVIIAALGEKLWFIIESKILIAYFDGLQDILVRGLSTVLLLVFSFQILMPCTCIWVIFLMWGNWSETKVVAAELWQPFDLAARWLGNLLSDPGKIITYIFIVFLLLAFPSLIATITSTA